MLPKKISTNGFHYKSLNDKQVNIVSSSNNTKKIMPSISQNIYFYSSLTLNETDFILHAWEKAVELYDIYNPVSKEKCTTFSCCVKIVSQDTLGRKWPSEVSNPNLSSAGPALGADQVAQVLVQSGLENLWGHGHHSLLGRPDSLPCCPTG